MRRILELPCVLILSAISCLAQLDSALVTQRGIQANSVYGVSELESINLRNGNMSLHVPLAALPPGPGGSSLQVGLAYNSQIYDVTTGVDELTGDQTYRLRNSTTGGGWQYSYGQYAFFEEERAWNGMYPDCSTDDAKHQYKHYLVYPDGGRHKLRIDVPSYVSGISIPTGPSSDDYDLYSADGNAGCSSVGSAMSSRPVLYTDDGTSVRVSTRRQLQFTANVWVSWGELATPTAVSVSVTNVPSGWAVTVNPNSIPVPSGTSVQKATVTLVPPSDATSGTYPIGISASAGGLQSSTGMTLSLADGTLTPDQAGSTPSSGFALTVTGSGIRRLAWTAYFPDGRKVDGIDAQTNTITDRNGNVITITGIFDPSSVAGPEIIVADRVNRRVKIAHGLASGGADRVTREYCNSTALCGPAASEWQASQTWQVLWQQYSGASKLHLCGSLAQGVHCNLTPGGEFVKQVVLPLAVSTEQERKYEFVYNTETNTTNGWGEVYRAATPGGHVVTYNYLSDGFSDINTLPLFWNPITSKVNTYEDSRSETSTYTITEGPNQAIVRGPEGVEARTYFTTMEGLPWKSMEPNGDTTETLWYHNRAPNCNTSKCWDNPYVKAEFRTLQRSSGISLASVKVYGYDKNNNLLSTDEYDCLTNSCGSIPRDGTGVPNGLPTLPAVTRHSEYTYYAETSAADDGSSVPVSNQAAAYWYELAPRLLNTRKTLKVTGTGAPIYSEYFYDARGNLTQQLDYDSTKAATLTPPLVQGTNAIRSFKGEYDNNGNLLLRYDAKDTQTKYEFGSGSCMNSYPTAVNTSENVSEEKLSTSMTWYCTSGLLDTSTDPNNVNTSRTYDVLGRVKSLTEGSGADTRTTSITYSDASRTVTMQTPLDSSRQLTTVDTYDSRGRLISTTQPNDNGSCTQTTVDHRYLTPTTGNASFYGFSYELVSNPYCSIADATMGWTRTKRDPNGRVVEVAYFPGATAPGPWESGSATASGVAKTSYDGAEATAEDPAGKKRKTRIDGLKRLVEVTEDPGGATYSTTYGYDLRDSLTSVSQTRKATGISDSAQARTYLYDSLGRLRSATNVESNETSYTYDDNGNVHMVQLAGGATRTYEYNSRNQIWKRSYSQLNTPTAFYCYDGKTATSTGCGTKSGVGYPAGRLTGIGSSSAVTNYKEYDSLGRVVKSEQVVDEQPYPFAYSYLLGGQLSYVKYPSGREVTYEYNAAGQAKSVAKGTVAGSCANGNCYASGLAYASHAALASGTFGPLTQSFSHNSRLQLTDIEARKGTALQWKLTNTYSGTANNGNITGQSVDATGAGGISTSATFVYDALNRLWSSTESGTGGIQQTYGYDSVGNRWVEAGQSNYIPSSSFTPLTATWYDGATNRLANSNMQYDSPDGPGNLTGMGGYALEYDGEGRLKKATLLSTLEYWYDGEGRRVKKQFGTGPATIYVYNAMGELAAEYGGSGQSAGTQYVVQDHLGSTRMVVDAAGTVQGLHDYLPFGEEIAAGAGGRTSLYGGGDGVAQKFTGKERDAELAGSAMQGLDYFGARYYSGAQGRFTSPDEPLYDQHPGDPQSWNLYSYVRNNPLKFTDPSGNDCIYKNTFDEKAGTVVVETGSCSQQGGTYVAGTIGSITYDKNSNSLDYGYTAYKGGTASVGSTALSNPDLGLAALQRGALLAGTVAEPLLEVTLAFISGPGMSMLSAVPEVTIGGAAVIGKLPDLRQPRPGENVLDLPNQGSPKANWIQNSGKLRQAMAEGRPIRDASGEPLVNGQPGNNTGFLRAERALLRDRGWVYRDGYWYPPKR